MQVYQCKLDEDPLLIKYVVGLGVYFSKIDFMISRLLYMKKVYLATSVFGISCHCKLYMGMRLRQVVHIWCPPLSSFGVDFKFNILMYDPYNNYVLTQDTIPLTDCARITSCYVVTANPLWLTNCTLNCMCFDWVLAKNNDSLCV